MKVFTTGLATCLMVSVSGFAHANPDSSCQGERVRKVFASGASWEFCWSIQDKEGLVLSQVQYQAPRGYQRRVLGEASLSQIATFFDDGAVDPSFVTTQFGLGSNMLVQTPAQCPSGELRSFNGRALLCSTTRQIGYLYKYNSQRQTERFDISTASQIGPRHYTVRWSFYENGTIEPAVGLSGILPAVGQSSAAFGWPVTANGDIASSFVDHYLWRLDFDIDATAANDVIEEISSTPTADRLRKTKSQMTLTQEIARSLDPETKRFWRVRDGETINEAPGVNNYISYELIPGHYDQSKANSRNDPWLANDFYFTAFNACERHGARNTATGCAGNMAQFVNQQNLEQQDVVVWYKQSNHFLPRSEDSNRVGVRWSSFKLLPRDWSAENPF